MPRAAKQISSGSQNFSLNQADLARAGGVSTNRPGLPRISLQSSRCVTGALFSSTTSKRFTHPRLNVERDKAERQKIHKKVEHDRRDLIKHWTKFLEELLPSDLKSDPEAKAKNGKPNLPKKVIYQLACKYIFIEQGRHKEYKATLRAQPLDENVKSSVVNEETRHKPKDDSLQYGQSEFSNFATTGNGISPLTLHDLGGRDPPYCIADKEEDLSFSTMTDKTFFLGTRPSTAWPESTRPSMYQGIP